MNIHKREAIQFSINVFLIAVAGVLLYLDFSAPVSSTGKVIGSITFKREIAQRRYVGHSVWQPLHQDSPVYNMDTIQTGPRSLAVVHLNDGTKINLDEETIIVLRMGQGEMSIDFNSGSISVGRRKDTRRAELKIKAGASTVRMQDGALALSGKGDKDLSLDVSAGKVALEGKSGTRTLSSNQQAAIDSKGASIVAAALVPASPAPGAVFVTGTGGMPVVFTRRVLSNQAAVLQISRERSFAAPVYQQPIGERVTVTLSPARYYWRLRAAGGKATSSVRVLTLEQDSSPVPLTPVDGGRFSFVRSKPLINFSWETSRLAGGYVVEIARSTDMEKPQYSLPSRGSSIATSQLGSGTWYWRVRAKYGFSSGESVPPGPVRSFVIEQQRELTRPVLVYPQPGARVSALLFEDNKAVFSWRESEGAERYQLQIASDRNFRNLLVKGEATANYYSMNRSLPAGRYFWRVQALADQQEKTSPMASFTITAVQPLQATRPARGSVLVEENRELSVLFRWQDPNQGNRYQLELARDKGFGKQRTTRESGSPQCRVSTLDTGTWYWRVHLLGTEEKRLASSKLWSFTLLRKPGLPVLQVPEAGAAIDMTQRNNLVFRWEKVPGAVRYRWRLYRVVGGTLRLRHQVFTAVTVHVLNNLTLLDRGVFRWTVAALGQDARAGWSEPAQRGFRIRLKKLEQPQFITPGSDPGR